MGAYLWWWSAHQIKYYETFLATETFVLYIHFLQNSIEHTTNNSPNKHELSTIPSTGWRFLPNFVAAQLWISPCLLSKNYSWLLPQQQIFWNSHSIETENLWSLNVMPVQKQFIFYPRTQWDWINNGGHTYKNTTHQNIIMHYLEFIFLTSTAVVPQTLPLAFRCLSNFQFSFTWWWKMDP